MDFDEVADRLYGLPPPQFTAARNTAAAQAKAAGDGVLAGRITALRRPTLGAWLANLLVREHPKECRALLDLGKNLRGAQEALDGAGLRTLTARRRAVVHALARQAKAAAVDAGLPVSDSVLQDLEEYLLSVLADPELAEAFAGARLTSLHGAGAQAVLTSSRPLAPLAPRGGQQAGARRVLAQAQREAKQAQAAADSARRALDKAAGAHERARRRVAELVEQLDGAREKERESAAAERTARARVEDTDRTARRAQGRARDAAAHQQHLTDRAA